MEEKFNSKKSIQFQIICMNPIWKDPLGQTSTVDIFGLMMHRGGGTHTNVRPVLSFWANERPAQNS